MTDWAASRSFFAQKLPKNGPKMRRDCPSTVLKLLPNPPENKNSK